MTDFLGKRLPKERDHDLSKIQAAVLACVRPLTSAWQQLLENGLENDQEMRVPAIEVLTLIQCTLCMVGNASKQISQIRRARILEAVDKSWSKFAETEVSPDNGFLCGENFRSRLTKDVEEDSSLAKALSVTRRNQKSVDSSSSRKGEQLSGRFFDRAPPHCTGLGRAEIRSRTIHILPTGKRANTTEVCSPQTSADPARAPSTTNRKSPPRSGKPNRRSLKTVMNTPRAQPKQTRTFTDGYAYLTCPPPHWRLPSLLHGQLGGSLQRPMGFGSGKVIQDRVYLRTKTKRTTWPNCHEPGTVPGHDSRNSRAPQERSGGAGGFSQQGGCQPSVPGAQVRWRMETSTKPQEPQSVCGSTPLQNGVHSYTRRCAPEGRLAIEARFEGRIPVHPHPPESPTFLEP